MQGGTPSCQVQGRALAQAECERRPKRPPIALIGAWTATHISGFVGQAPACPVYYDVTLQHDNANPSSCGKKRNTFLSEGPYFF
jgi:hypothetical protein